MSVIVKSLSYAFQNSTELALDDINLCLPEGSRVLLIGANGAGKSTLLRLLAGKRIAPEGTITINDFDPFRQDSRNIIFLGNEWVNDPVVHRDVVVKDLIGQFCNSEDIVQKRKCEYLVETLEIDCSWHMNSISDGQRRRVQICLALLRPWRYLFLDEVTVDLDVLARRRLLEYLSEETNQRNATIIYATHIFDGMAGWPSIIVHLTNGRMTQMITKTADLTNRNSKLHDLALEWITADKKTSRKRKQVGTFTHYDDNFFTSHFKNTRNLLKDSQ